MVLRKGPSCCHQNGLITREKHSDFGELLKGLAKTQQAPWTSYLLPKNILYFGNHVDINKRRKAPLPGSTCNQCVSPEIAGITFPGCKCVRMTGQPSDPGVDALLQISVHIAVVSLLHCTASDAQYK